MTLAKQIKTDQDLPLVAIVGRTNVGKSTLFNTLVGKKRALVSKISGTTRDTNLSEAEWNGHDFLLADLGGFMDVKYLFDKKAAAQSIDQQVQKQARGFLTRADVILFVVDAKEGINPDDRKISSGLKHLDLNKKIILVANKADNAIDRSEASTFFKLGLGEPQSVSAASGSGTGDLLELVCQKFFKSVPSPELGEGQGEVFKKEEKNSYKLNKPVKICLLGKPNVGKSSLLNAILGYERVLVSPVAHTTREPQNTEINYKNNKLIIIDTAGIHKQGLKTGPAKSMDAKFKRLEHQGIAMTLKTLSSADIAILVLDINEELTKQDVKLAEKIIELKKSLIIVANKWDLATERDTVIYSQNIYGKIPFARFAPIQFLSAKTKEKVDKLLNLALEIQEHRHLEIPEADLKEFIHYCVSKHLPTKGKGQRYPKIRSLKQTGTNPPEFAVKIGAKEFLADSYLHFLQNRLRERYNLKGTPVVFWVDKANVVHGKADN